MSVAATGCAGRVMLRQRFLTCSGQDGAVKFTRRTKWIVGIGLGVAVCASPAVSVIASPWARTAGYDQYVWRSDNKDRYLAQLEERMVTDFGKRSASCERVR